AGCSGRTRAVTGRLLQEVSCVREVSAKRRYGMEELLPPAPLLIYWSSVQMSRGRTRCCRRCGYWRIGETLSGKSHSLSLARLCSHRLNFAARQSICGAGELRRAPVRLRAGRPVCRLDSLVGGISSQRLEILDYRHAFFLAQPIAEGVSAVAPARPGGV